MELQYVVYILASRRNGTLYVGMTNDLVRRVAAHKHGEASSFTKKYGVTMLVYYEMSEDVRSVIERETNIKRWRRAWKLELIESFNPLWKDLSDDIAGFPLKRE